MFDSSLSLCLRPGKIRGSERGIDDQLDAAGIQIIKRINLGLCEVQHLFDKLRAVAVGLRTAVEDSVELKALLHELPGGLGRLEDHEIALL